MKTDKLTLHPPPVIVRATENCGHSVEDWSEMLTDRLVAVADDAPEPIRAQARAFKDAIREVIRWHMEQAVRSDRLTLLGGIRKDGFINQEQADYLFNWGL